MYIRAKQIPKKTSTGTRYYTYFYLVSGTRHGSKVKQKVIRYLGKNPSASVIKRYGPLLPPPELGTTAPSPGLAKSLNFSPITNTKGHGSQTFLLHWAQQLGATRIVFGSAKARARRGTRGFYHPALREIHIAATKRSALTYTLAHEIGHLVDFHVLQGFHQSAQFATSDLDAELNELAKRRMDWAFGGIDAQLENAARYASRAKAQATRDALTNWIETAKRSRERYFELRAEQFADLFACCLLEPRKTKAVAPTAYRLLLAQCRAHPKLAAFLRALQTPKKLDKA